MIYAELQVEKDIEPEDKKYQGQDTELEINPKEIAV